jgi:hypothetical protein
VWIIKVAAVRDDLDLGHDGGAGRVARRAVELIEPVAWVVDDTGFR